MLAGQRLFLLITGNVQHFTADICCWLIYAVSYVKVALVLLWALSAAKARRSERSSASLRSMSLRSMSEPVSFSSADSLPAGPVPSNPGGRYH
jgi:hypothetical protein